MAREQRERNPQSAHPFPVNLRFAFRKHMIINREFELLLQNNGLDNFDTIMEINGGEVVKQKIKERSTIRFQVADGEHKVLLYLKRYRHPLISAFLKNFLTLSRTYSAVHEWRNILALKACNIPTMTPVAVGMRRRMLFLKESFLLTQGILDTTPLECLVADYFTPPLDTIRRERKRRLISNVASLTRKMHEEGYKHQDFYLCHILINWTEPDNPLLYIADLHRVKKQEKSHKRWRIKDLAALNYSAPEKLISQKDRLRFLKEYDPLLLKDRLFIKAIIRKTERIRSHAEKERG